MPAVKGKPHGDQRRQDKHAQFQLRLEIAREHRPDLSASDLGQIAVLTGNYPLAAKVRRAYGKDQK